MIDEINYVIICENEENLLIRRLNLNLIILNNEDQLKVLLESLNISPNIMTNKSNSNKIYFINCNKSSLENCTSNKYELSNESNDNPLN